MENLEFLKSEVNRTLKLASAQTDDDAYKKYKRVAVSTFCHYVNALRRAHADELRRERGG